MRTARVTVMNLQSLAAKRLSQAQTQKLEARQEDLHVWGQKKVKQSKASVAQSRAQAQAYQARHRQLRAQVREISSQIEEETQVQRGGFRPFLVA